MSAVTEKQTRFSSGDVLFREGDEGDFFYIIVEGNVGVYRDYDRNRIPLAAVREGEAVGEMTVIDERTRSATAVALTPVKVIRRSRSEVDQQLLLCPVWFTTIVMTLVERLRRLNDVVVRNHIRDPKLLSELETLAGDAGERKLSVPDSEEPQEDFDKIRPERTVQFKRGDIVLREGDSGGYFYFVTSGCLGVFKDYDKERIPLAQVTRLQVLGEMSVVDGSRRSATTIALTDVNLMKITKQGFDRQLHAQQRWFRTLIATIVERLRRTNEIIDRSKTRDVELVKVMHDVYVDTIFNPTGQRFQGIDTQPVVVSGKPEIDDGSDDTLVKGSAHEATDDTLAIVEGEMEDMIDQSETTVRGDKDSKEESFIIKGGAGGIPKSSGIVRDARNQSTLLVVDPDPTFAEPIANNLAPHGIKVIACRTGDQAQIKLANQKFDCMLINLHLTRGKVPAIIHRLRQVESSPNSKMPIFLVALDSDADIIRSLKNQISDVFMAPVDAEAIATSVLASITENELAPSAKRK